MPFENCCAFLAAFVLFLFVYNCNSVLIKIYNYFFNYQRPPKRQYHLPNEILVNIFKYLHTPSNELRKQKNRAASKEERRHQKTFRSLRLVCSQWNEVATELFDIRGFDIIVAHCNNPDEVKCKIYKIGEPELRIAEMVEIVSAVNPNLLIDVQFIDCDPTSQSLLQLCQLLSHIKQLRKFQFDSSRTGKAKFETKCFEAVLKSAENPVSLKIFVMRSFCIDNKKGDVLTKFLGRHNKLTNVFVEHQGDYETSKQLFQLLPDLIRPNVPSGYVLEKTFQLYSGDNVVHCWVEKKTEDGQRERTWLEVERTGRCIVDNEFEDLIK